MSQITDIHIHVRCEKLYDYVSFNELCLCTSRWGPADRPSRNIDNLEIR